MDPMSGKILARHLIRKGLQILTTEVTENFEALFRGHFPDFVVLHCHNSRGDFDVVKRATHIIRRLHPGCILYVTCSSDTLDYYTIRYRFQDYYYDDLLSSPLQCGELLAKLMHHLSRRYHLSPTQS
ncbi:hypothetical protein [Chitinophaga qingshengii]|uniref:Response regulator n=1 Tax=Chitinophaga qingshengii TaxID=1569794 RepID=A0ABR7TU32_9BACT|nr:hypothetical protein [Chitinophaga qingshengii]MBC9932909.1 hypothetical protein [Chitinophaga qingshengii]